MSDTSAFDRPAAPVSIIPSATVWQLQLVNSNIEGADADAIADANADTDNDDDVPKVAQRVERTFPIGSAFSFAVRPTIAEPPLRGEEHRPAVVRIDRGARLRLTRSTLDTASGESDGAALWGAAALSFASDDNCDPLTLCDFAGGRTAASDLGVEVSGPRTVMLGISRWRGYGLVGSSINVFGCVIADVPPSVPIPTPTPVVTPLPFDGSIAEVARRVASQMARGCQQELGVLHKLPPTPADRVGVLRSSEGSDVVERDVEGIPDSENAGESHPITEAKAWTADETTSPSPASRRLPQVEVSRPVIDRQRAKSKDKVETDAKLGCFQTTPLGHLPARLLLDRPIPGIGAGNNCFSQTCRTKSDDIPVNVEQKVPVVSDPSTWPSPAEELPDFIANFSPRVSFTTVRALIEEYMVGVDGRPALREVEARYGPEAGRKYGVVSWRNAKRLGTRKYDMAISRRRSIYEKIEEGMNEEDLIGIVQEHNPRLLDKEEHFSDGTIVRWLFKHLAKEREGYERRKEVASLVSAKRKRRRKEEIFFEKNDRSVMNEPTKI